MKALKFFSKSILTLLSIKSKRNSYMNSSFNKITFLEKIRRSKISKVTSGFMVSVILFGDVYSLKALSEGPKTPESSGFSALTPAENVSLYSGDFSYNIPLFTMNDYPFNLTYNSNISMEQEASWVGLGWNLDIGAIDRHMKGLPDDFDGDIIKEENNTRPNTTVMLGIGMESEIIGSDINKLKGNLVLLPKKIKKLVDKISIKKSFQLGYNTYNGFIWNLSGGYSLDFPISSKSKHTSKIDNSFDLSLNYTIGSGGISLSPGLSLSEKFSDNVTTLVGNVGFNFNVSSSSGIQGVNFGYNMKSTIKDLYKNQYKNDFDVNVLEGNISYSPLSFPPSGNLRYKNFSGAVTVKVPIETFWVGTGTSFSGFYSSQKLFKKQVDYKGMGYLYMNNVTYDGDVLTDVYREKDLAYMPGVPYLPQTQVQPDMFNVHTMGFSGTYRAFKNTAVLTGNHNFVANKGHDVKVDFEFGAGNAFKGALNPTYGVSTQNSGYWIIQNNAFGSTSNSNKFSNGFSNIYFRKIEDGGKGISTTYFGGMYNTDAVAYKLHKDKFNYYLQNSLQVGSSSSGSALGVFADKYNGPEYPASSTTFLPIKYKQIKLHPLYNKLYKQYYDSVNIVSKDHHITHIEILNEKGQRFVFGCPAYNKLQKEVSFNIGGEATFDGSNFNILNVPTTTYNPGDNSTSNSKGLQHYYHSQEIPAYVYAYHLTEIYSPEYSDIKGDGPTPDDAGDYLIFHYNRKITDYKWRSPMSNLNYIAQYQPGALSKNDDGMGVYSYGVKDVWYIDTVRSKTEIAIFYTSQRSDAREANGENGGLGSQYLHKLDSIVLYDLQEFLLHKQSTLQALRAKKRIYFVYDYTLCQGVPNSLVNNGGKLTLKSVIIMNGNSMKDQISKYFFTYNSNNPLYNLGRNDRYGNDMNPILGSNNTLYPYRPSDKAQADSAAQAWRLKQIELPGGGSIEIEYESDDYVYVQDKRAMQMFRLHSISNSSNSLGLPGTITNISTGSWLIFETDIPSSVSLSTAQAEFNKYFLEDVNSQMYFKVAMNVTKPGGNFGNRYEMVYGFAEIESKNVFKDNSTNKYYGAIKLKNISYKGSTYHPFQMAAMQWVFTNAQHFYQDKTPTYYDDPISVVQFVVNEFIQSPSFFANQLVALLSGPFKYMDLKGFGKNIAPQYSWIRLCVRDRKYSGTSRVKRVIYKNNWQSKTGESNADITHVKRYYYEMQNGTSSGVAANEPMVGADENTLRRGISYQNNTSFPAIMKWTRLLTPNINYTYYNPINEGQMPGPSVGYRRVVVKEEVQAPYSSNGYEEHWFYTDYDFPVQMKSTPMDQDHVVKNLNYVKLTHAVASQGFCTVLSDMPGKPKEVKIYDGKNTLVTHKIYHYTFDPVKYLKDDNSIESAYSGLDMDVVVDWREEKSISSNFQLQLNLDLSIVGIFPIPIPTAWPNVNYSESVFRSSVVNKTVYMHGVLKEEEIMDKGANVSVKHYLFDPVSGADVLNSVKEKYGNERFSFSLPAYHVYKNMGSASVNTGIIMKIITNNSGVISYTPNTIQLRDGDKLMSITNNADFMWVYKAGSNNYLIDRSGNTVNNYTSYVMVYESGNRNKLGEFVEQYTMKKSPISVNNIQINTSREILTASASTYTDYFSVVSDSCKISCKDTSGTWTGTLIAGQNYTYHPTYGMLGPTMASSNMPVVQVTVNVQDNCQKSGGKCPDCTSAISVSACLTPNDSIYLSDGNLSYVTPTTSPTSTVSPYSTTLTGTMTQSMQPLNSYTKSPPSYSIFPPSNNTSTTISTGTVNNNTTTISTGTVASPHQSAIAVSPTSFSATSQSVTQTSASSGTLLNAPCATVTLNGYDVSCAGTCDGKLVLNINSACVGPYILDWSPSICSPLPTLTMVPTPGTYTINNVCACGNPYQVILKDTNNVVLSISNSAYVVGPSQINVTALNYIPSCSGCNGYLSLAIGGGWCLASTPCSYTVKVGSPSGSITTYTNVQPYFISSNPFVIPNVCSGTYTIQVKDIMGCTKTVTLNLSPGSIQTFSMNGLCPNVHHVVISHQGGLNTVIDVPIMGGFNGMLPPNLKVNPFVYHLRNAWRVHKSYVYYTNRIPKNINTSVQLPKQSHYEKIDRFWLYTGTWMTNEIKWKLVSVVDYCNINGVPIQEHDISGIYSSAQYGWKGLLQEAIAYNARSEEIAFESFELNYMPVDTPNTYKPHFRFDNIYANSSKITGIVAHTGLYSAKLVPNDSLVYNTNVISGFSKQFFPSYSAPPPFYVYPSYYSDKFAPYDTIRTYEISLWARCIPLTPSSQYFNIVMAGMTSPVNCVLDSNYVEIYLNQTKLNVTKVYESPEIEGWKQYRFELTLQNPVACDRLKIKIKNAGNLPLYVDDVRINPKDAMVKNFVYYPYTKLLAAVLDENGFAARYVYNNRNELQEVVKETEKGNVFVMYKKMEKR